MSGLAAQISTSAISRRRLFSRGFLALVTVLCAVQASVLCAVAQDIEGDLVVLVDVPGASSTPGVGATISVTDITRNISVRPVGASTTRLYLSVNSTFDATAIALADRAVPPLGPGETSSRSTTFALPGGHAGLRYIFAVADADNAVLEGNDGNNVSPAQTITIGGDLVVWIDVPGNIANAAAGSTVDVSDWTRSDNSAPVGASTTKFYLVTGTTIDAGAVLLGSRAVPALGPSATHAGTTPLTLPASAAGTFRIIARADADDAVPETNEGNNASAASQAFALGPDLIVSVDVPGASLAVAAGATVSVTDFTRNRGSTPVGASTTRFYLSPDANLDPGDVPLGSRTVPALGPSSARDVGVTPVTLPTGIAGSYRVIAVADADGAHPESDEANNVSVSQPIAIGPDLIVSGTTVPARGVVGATLFVSDVTKNRGAGAALASSTGYYLSRDGVLDAGDILLGTRAMGPLAAGQQHQDTTTAVIPVTTPLGCYVLIAAADDGGAVAETDEANNTSPAKAIQISPSSRVTMACVRRQFGDLDGDGKADLLWRDGEGRVGIWLMDGTGVRETGVPSSAPPEWTIQGVGDFDGDGKVDILWRDTGGQVGIWLMDGTSISGLGTPASAPLEWAIQGVGDFDGDGKADILWRDGEGHIGIWLMDGLAIGGAGIPSSAPSEWTIQGVGDFDGDGKADILWREGGGQIGIWLMDGLVIRGAGIASDAPLTWMIHGIGDFDGDGRADILWRDATGQVGVWLMEGLSVRAMAVPAGVPLEWAIQGVGDFDGDGKADILWRDATGQVGMWLMDGTSVNTMAVPATVELNWAIQ